MLSILSWWLVNSIHLCDKEKHKAKQNTKDSDYNVFYYRRRYNIEVSTTIHALKYHLCIYIFMLDEVYSCGQPQSIWFPTTWCRRKEESFLIFFPHCILSLCVVFPFAFALSFSFGFHHFFCFVYQPNNIKKKETNKKNLFFESSCTGGSRVMLNIIKRRMRGSAQYRRRGLSRLGWLFRSFLLFLVLLALLLLRNGTVHHIL